MTELEVLEKSLQDLDKSYSVLREFYKVEYSIDEVEDLIESIRVARRKVRDRVSQEKRGHKNRCGEF